MDMHWHMALAELPSGFPFGFLAAYFLSAYLMFGAGLLLSRRLFRFDLARQGLFGFGCGYSNLMLIGIPLVLTAWGESAVLPLFTIVAAHTLAMFPPLTYVLESDRRASGMGIRQILPALGGVARNQYILGILAGLAWNLSGVALPGSIDAVLGMFAASATPCALFCMGATLAHYRIAGELTAALTVSAIKVLVFPAVVWGIGGWVFSLDPMWLAVAVTVAAMPVGINIYLFAEQYDKGVALSATAIVLSTALSVFTLTAVLTILGVG